MIKYAAKTVTAHVSDRRDSETEAILPSVGLGPVLSRLCIMKQSGGFA